MLKIPKFRGYQIMIIFTISEKIWKKKHTIYFEYKSEDSVAVDLGVYKYMTEVLRVKSFGYIYGANLEFQKMIMRSYLKYASWLV